MSPVRFPSWSRYIMGSGVEWINKETTTKTSYGHSLCHSGNDIRKWSGNRCVFAIPREFPFIPIPSKFLGGRGGSITPVTIFPPTKKQTERDSTHTVTEIRGHCSEGGKGWGLGSSLFPGKNTLILKRLAHPKSWFFDANCLSDSIAIPKNKLRSRAKFLRIPHSPSHSLKILRKENESFPDSHSLMI